MKDPPQKYQVGNSHIYVEKKSTENYTGTSDRSADWEARRSGKDTRHEAFQALDRNGFRGRRESFTRSEIIRILNRY